MNRVLLVDDDRDILALNLKYLREKGYVVQTAHSAGTALQAIAKSSFDCIVLDAMLPDLTGFDLCSRIRENVRTPIIFLSCMDSVDDKISGLAAGGDDYVVKPIAMRELEARIHVQIRRTGGLSVDARSRVLLYQGRSVLLSKTEFDLFQILFRYKNQAVPFRELFAVVESNDVRPGNTLAVYIRRLRKKLEAFAPAFSIESDRGVGYHFREHDPR